MPYPELGAESVATKRTAQQEGQELALDEVIDLHRHKWVLLKVTKFDDHHQPTSGQVIAVSKSDRGVWRKFEELHAQRGGRMGGTHYIFYAFEPIPPGTPMHEMLEEAARKGPPRGWSW